MLGIMLNYLLYRTEHYFWDISVFFCRCLNFFRGQSQAVEAAELKASIGECAAGRGLLLNLYSTCIYLHHSTS